MQRNAPRRTRRDEAAPVRRHSHGSVPRPPLPSPRPLIRTGRGRGAQSCERCTPHRGPSHCRIPRSWRPTRTSPYPALPLFVQVGRQSPSANDVDVDRTRTRHGHFIRPAVAILQELLAAPALRCGPTFDAHWARTRGESLAGSGPVFRLLLRDAASPFCTPAGSQRPDAGQAHDGDHHGLATGAPQAHAATGPPHRAKSSRVPCDHPLFVRSGMTSARRWSRIRSRARRKPIDSAKPRHTPDPLCMAVPRMPGSVRRGWADVPCMRQIHELSP
jgi:hypothetical protein